MYHKYLLFIKLVKMDFHEITSSSMVLIQKSAFVFGSGVTRWNRPGILHCQEPNGQAHHWYLYIQRYTFWGRTVF